MTINLLKKEYSLEKMRKFYLTFPNSATLSRKLSWSHYCLILRKDDQLARNFYIKEEVSAPAKTYVICI